MVTIRTDGPYVTQINVIEVAPKNQAELVGWMREQVEFAGTLPGFVSSSLHVSLDGSRIVNYVQWETAEGLDAFHEDLRFATRLEHYKSLALSAGPRLYDVAVVRSSSDAEDCHG